MMLDTTHTPSSLKWIIPARDEARLARAWPMLLKLEANPGAFKKEVDAPTTYQEAKRAKQARVRAERLDVLRQTVTGWMTLQEIGQATGLTPREVGARMKQLRDMGEMQTIPHHRGHSRYAPAGLEPPDLRHWIVKALAKHGQMTTQQIADMAGITSQSAGSLAGHLHLKGEIRPVGVIRKITLWEVA